MTLNEKCLSEKVIWLLVTFLFSSFIIFDTKSFISLILLAITLIIFILDICQTKSKIIFKIEAFHILILFFALYCFVSALWGIRSGAAIQKGVTIVEILICMSIIYMHYSKGSTVKPLVSAVMWAGYVVVIYAFIFYGLGTIKSIISAGERLGNSFANINSIGMLAAISIIITVYQIFYVKKKITIDNVLIVPCIVMVAASGSRKALIMTVCGLVYIIITKYSTKNLIKNLFTWIGLGIILFFLLCWASTLPMFEGVMSRMESLTNLLKGTGGYDQSSWIRQQFIKIGMSQFYLHPIKGIGINSSGAILAKLMRDDTYFHNNYVELLACGGIIGTIIYYNIYFYLIKEMLKNKHNKDVYYNFCVILIILLLFMDYANVTYFSKTQYFYFVILFLEIQNLRKSSRNKMGVINEK